METQTRTTGGDTLLGLGSVLVGSLPATLLTDHAPARYTVEAVFTRRPEPDEITDILGADTRALLARSGYPTIELTVSDRRLEIANTSLEELRDGLADTLVDRLAEISAGVKERRRVAAERFEFAAAHEHERAAAVAELAESVTFRAGRLALPEQATPEDSEGDAVDREDIAEWEDEGGHGR